MCFFLLFQVWKAKKDGCSDWGRRVGRLSARIHSRFEHIHPFSDGNGRVGRLLMNAMLLQKNLAPAIIRQEQKQLYYAYLYKAQTKDDTSQLENFICDAIVDGFKILERADV